MKLFAYFENGGILFRKVWPKVIHAKGPLDPYMCLYTTLKFNLVWWLKFDQRLYHQKCLRLSFFKVIFHKSHCARFCQQPVKIDPNFHQIWIQKYRKASIWLYMISVWVSIVPTSKNHGKNIKRYVGTFSFFVFSYEFFSSILFFFVLLIFFENGM